MPKNTTPNIARTFDELVELRQADCAVTVFDIVAAFCAEYGVHPTEIDGTYNSVRYLKSNEGRESVMEDYQNGDQDESINAMLDGNMVSIRNAAQNRRLPNEIIDRNTARVALERGKSSKKATTSKAKTTPKTTVKSKANGKSTSKAKSAPIDDLDIFPLKGGKFMIKATSGYKLGQTVSGTVQNGEREGEEISFTIDKQTATGFAGYESIDESDE